jgi:hypothetical protein
MNSYEAKQEARRQRLLELAAKREREASQRFGTAREIGSHIPLGQPILVGHHSEKRARSDAARIDNNMRAGVEASKKSDYYAGKAASVGSGGISADDPEAIDKLREKLAGMEADQERMKAVNKICASKKLTDEQKTASLNEMGIGATRAARLISGEDTYGKPGYPSYALQNNNANIHRVRERIAHLEHREQVRAVLLEEKGSADVEEQHGDITYRENTELNRVQLLFPGKPPLATRDMLSAHGFRWSPTEKAWQRQLNGNGIFAARQVLAKAVHRQPQTPCPVP